MFNIDKELFNKRKKRLEEQKEKIPFQTLMKWLDARQLPLKIDDFAKNNKPNLIIDLKVTQGENGDPSLLLQNLIENGIKIFSASGIEEWDNGYGDYISYLKRGRLPVKNPIIRRDILIENYQIVDSKLIVADGITMFPEFLTSKEIDNLFNDSINLDFHALPVLKSKKDIKKIEKFEFKTVAISYNILKKLGIKPSDYENIIIYDLFKTEDVFTLFNQGYKFFWLDWDTFDKDRESWYKLTGK